MSTRSRWLIDKSEAVSRGAMVTAMHPLAADVGAQILERGGSAIDAAIATAFAIGVVEPFMSGVGGIAFLVYRDAATGQTVCFDGSSVLPAAIRPEMFELLDPSERTGMYMWRATRDDANNTGWLSPAVPGMPALMQEAHRRYGRLPWRELLQPAIRLAAEGFEVDFYVGMFIAANYERLHRCETSRRTFYKPSGAPLSPSTGFTPGDRLVQTDLARTLAPHRRGRRRRRVPRRGRAIDRRGHAPARRAHRRSRSGRPPDRHSRPGAAGHLPRLRDHGQLENSGYADGGRGAEHPRGLRPRAGLAPSPSRPSISSSRRFAGPSSIGCASSATPRSCPCRMGDDLRRPSPTRGARRSIRPGPPRTRPRRSVAVRRAGARMGARAGERGGRGDDHAHHYHRPGPQPGIAHLDPRHDLRLGGRHRPGRLSASTTPPAGSIPSPARSPPSGPASASFPPLHLWCEPSRSPVAGAGLARWAARHLGGLPVPGQRRSTSG